jgi:hypothetical protein
MDSSMGCIVCWRGYRVLVFFSIRNHGKGGYRDALVHVELSINFADAFSHLAGSYCIHVH